MTSVTSTRLEIARVYTRPMLDAANVDVLRLARKECLREVAQARQTRGLAPVGGPLVTTSYWRRRKPDGEWVEVAADDPRWAECRLVVTQEVKP